MHQPDRAQEGGDAVNRSKTVEVESEYQRYWAECARLQGAGAPQSAITHASAQHYERLNELQEMYEGGE